MQKNIKFKRKMLRRATHINYFRLWFCIICCIIFAVELVDFLCSLFVFIFVGLICFLFRINYGAP